MHYGASGKIFQYAETLRKNMTPSEKIIWEKVYRNQLGLRIRRQHPVAPLNPLKGTFTTVIV
jgi:very-short-patch-repair endonuclease